eukprot:TRINITY_DN850_c0_g1_i2.p1 TRINITY_DN850_c0_g1~~TRINITY_DN850_c0_g1_i2.p1  ORF type:complete len:203 (-),score=41.03 TRINITY_DN850_c0_g1_i2:144-752(-)
MSTATTYMQTYGMTQHSPTEATGFGRVTFERRLANEEYLAKQRLLSAANSDGNRGLSLAGPTQSKLSLQGSRVRSLSTSPHFSKFDKRWEMEPKQPPFGVADLPLEEKESLPSVTLPIPGNPLRDPRRRMARLGVISNPVSNIHTNPLPYTTTTKEFSADIFTQGNTADRLYSDRASNGLAANRREVDDDEVLWSILNGYRK